MSGFLDALERELVGAAERHPRPTALGPAAHTGVGSSGGMQRRVSHHTPSRAHRPCADRAPLRTLAFAVTLALGAAAAALAATATIFAGEPVASTPHLHARAGVGIPSRGRSRLLARTVPDPAGGLRWGLRIVHTSRGEVCLQVGRVDHGEIGVIGEDGAFHDDGLFHRLPRAALKAGIGPHGFAVSCMPEGSTSEQELHGVPESAELPSAGRLGRRSAERQIYFGLLGPHAISLTYRADGLSHTIPVEDGGAYLFVLPEAKPEAKRSSVATEAGSSMGFVTEEQGRLSAVAPIVSIRYRLHKAGRLESCNEASADGRASRPCPRESSRERLARFKREAHPPSLHVSLDVTLEAVRHPAAEARRRAGDSPHTTYDAVIAFKAPFAVEGADAGYTLETHLPRCGAPSQRGGGAVLVDGIPGFARGALARDYARGATVRVTATNVFANDGCGKPERLEIDYYRLGSSARRVVGERIIRMP